MDVPPVHPPAATSGGLPQIRVALRYDPRPEPGAGPVAALYQTLLAHAELAEATGVDLVWLSERPFQRGARMPAALPIAAALVVRTRRLRVGVGPLALPLYHPLRVAEDAATLDALSGGRIELALGLGGESEAFAGFGVSRRERGSRLEEGIALVEAAFGGEPIVFRGEHHTVSDVTVSPRPVQRPGPPLWVGADADVAVERAARLGAGLLATRMDAIPRFLALCRARASGATPIRVAFECSAAEALRPETHAAVAQFLHGVTDVACFDLVVEAAASRGPGLLAASDIAALCDVREALSRPP